MNEPRKQRTYWRYHCSVMYATKQWRNDHEKFSFAPTYPTSQSIGSAIRCECELKFQWSNPRTVVFSQYKSCEEPEWLCWPCNSLFELQVVHRYVFIVA